jgi:hypothetical protein
MRKIVSDGSEEGVSGTQNKTIDDGAIYSSTDILQIQNVPCFF